MRLLLALVLLVPSWALAAPARSAAAKAEFRRAHPCPATGQVRGACPGWVIDHVVPLCAGGEDHPANMQWQAVEPSRLKDREERAQCALIRRGG